MYEGDYDYQGFDKPTYQRKLFEENQFALTQHACPRVMKNPHEIESPKNEPVSHDIIAKSQSKIEFHPNCDHFLLNQRYIGSNKRK